MRIEYKSLALRDLAQKQNYISNELKNKSAAKKLTAAILRAVSQLAEHPHMGAPLNSRFEIESDLRFIVVAKQIVFYQIVEGEYISVVRILDGRQDYMAILFE